MYTAKTVITPLHYAIKLNKAIDCLNGTEYITQHLQNLDVTILQLLADNKKGITFNKLRLACRNKVNVDKFYRSIDRLITSAFIVKTVYKQYHYYTITLQGRKIVTQLNAHLIAIVNAL